MSEWNVKYLMQKEIKKMHEKGLFQGYNAYQPYNTIPENVTETYTSSNRQKGPEEN